MNTKSLIVAGFAVLSLSASAMAQEGGGPSMRTPGYWDDVMRTAPDTARIPAGASDVETTGNGAGAMLHPDYTTLANPG